jgi:hypothetical protein
MEALDDIVNAITDILLVFEEAQSDLKTNLIVESKNLDVLLNEINSMIAHNRKMSEEMKVCDAIFDVVTGYRMPM